MNRKASGIWLLFMTGLVWMALVWLTRFIAQLIIGTPLPYVKAFEIDVVIMVIGAAAVLIFRPAGL